MKIAFLAPANSIHTRRWVATLASRGHRITLYSQHPDDAARECGVQCVWLPFRGNTGYILNVPVLWNLLRKLKPELVAAHYASGYGTTGALAGYRPLVMSVWGSDVYDFPYESRFNAALIRSNLRRASLVASTSHVMAEQVCRLVPELPAPSVTPFGVDCAVFSPRPNRKPGYISIGSVRRFASKYGLDVLVRAFALLPERVGGPGNEAEDSVRLMLIGGGPQRPELEALIGSLGLEDRVTLEEQVPHDAVPGLLNQFDVFVAPSRLDSESFGVAAVEASACGLPVVVSDAGGLPEVVRDGSTGIVVPREDPEALASALLRLLENRALRETMGEAGRSFVLEKYEWGKCVDLMEGLYRRAIDGRRRPG